MLNRLTVVSRGPAALRSSRLISSPKPLATEKTYSPGALGPPCVEPVGTMCERDVCTPPRLTTG